MQEEFDSPQGLVQLSHQGTTNILTSLARTVFWLCLCELRTLRSILHLKCFMLLSPPRHLTLNSNILNQRAKDFSKLYHQWSSPFDDVGKLLFVIFDCSINSKINMTGSAIRQRTPYYFPLLLPREISGSSQCF